MTAQGDLRAGYKPALLAGRQRVEIGETHLVCLDGNGREKWSIAWRDITRLAFVQHSLRAMKMSRLDIGTRQRRRLHSLGCNSADMDPLSDPDYVGFLAAVAAVVERLAETRPDLPVTMGEYGRPRLAMFVIGVVATLGSIALPVAAVASGRGDRILGEALAPIFILLAVGLVFAWSNAPWRKSLKIPTSLFLKALKGMDDDRAKD